MFIRERPHDQPYMGGGKPPPPKTDFGGNMSKIMNLSIDLETRSSADLAKGSVYRYAESPDFDVLLFGVSVNHGPVQVYDLARGECVPGEILAALTDSSIEKWAYNCSFERVCLSVWLRRRYPEFFPAWNKDDDYDHQYLDPGSWRCSMVLGAYNGLPMGLEKIGAVLGLEQQKLKEGRELIRLFCLPAIPSLINGGGTWNRPEDYPEKWELFKHYNQRDVEVEIQIQERLSRYPVPEAVWEEYQLDQRINDRGIRIDRDLVREAIRIDAISKVELTEKLKTLTGMKNPNSVAELKQYLHNHGIEIDTLGKKEATELIKTVPEDLREVLELRLQIAKSSVKKYQAMEDTVGSDGRCRGLFQFYGASRTGRWAGRLIQLQNLPQNHMEDLDPARELIRQGDYELVKMLYPSVPGVLSELIRTAFVPRPGCIFIVADFSAIEARALSYLAGEQWRIDLFHNGGDIYCQSASQMFKVPVEKHGQNSHLRQRGKVAELACGYGGSTGALRSMGALQMGLQEEELKPLVDMWRKANPKIEQYWWDVDAAAKAVLREGGRRKVGNLFFEARSGMLFILLPSGRRLAYVKPRLEPNRFGGESITYMGTDAQKKWARIETYGPKLVENITQAICRDILAFAMKNLAEGGYRIVAHVHDEVIIEAPIDAEVEAICGIMGRTPDWLPGIELKADGYGCMAYRKN